jgi:hypothetical protein
MESLLLLKGFKFFVILLLITGCTPERDNPFDPLGEDREWISIERPEAITVFSNGNLCIANGNGFNIFTTNGDPIDCYYPTGGVTSLDVGFGKILSVDWGVLRLFSRDGTFQTLVDEYIYEGQRYEFSKLTGIYADDGSLYLIDSNLVIEMDSNFECTSRWESFENKVLYDIFYSNGYLYATLKNSVGMQIFDTSGNFIKEENLETIYGGDEYFSRGITGDNAGNLFFFAFSIYFSSLDSTYYIEDSWIYAVKEINYEGTPFKLLIEIDLMDIVYCNGYLYVAKYWSNSVRKLWLDGYIP